MAKSVVIANIEGIKAIILRYTAGVTLQEDI